MNGRGGEGRTVMRRSLEDAGRERTGALTGVGVRRARVIGFVIGLALVGAAGWVIVARREAVSGSWDSIRGASWVSLGIAGVLPVVSVGLSAATFWILTTRYGRVGRVEMFALIGSAWLLNYLPLWPGMIGRLTYHTRVNGIAVRDSAKAILWANALNLLAALGLAGCVAVGAMFFAGGDARFAALTVTPVVVLAIAGVYAHRAKPAPDPEVWRLLAALSIRLVELHVHAARSFVCFGLVGAPIAWGGALAIASATGLASAVNVAPNGLGVREWVVGLVAPALPAGLSLRGDLRLAQGLSADLVNRAIEAMVAVPLGLLCAAWLARRRRLARVADQ